MHLYTTTYRSQWFSDMASIAAAGIETSFSFLTQKQHSPCISITNLRCQTLRIHPQSSYSPAAATLLQASPDKNTNNVLLSGRRNRSGTLPPAAVRHLVGSLVKAEGLRFAIVVARFNEVVTKLLMEGALETFKRYSVREEDIDVVWVPGSFEIPIVAERLGKLGKYQAVLCIGAVVRGDTTHYDAVANSAASGVLSAGLNSGVPCIFGVLTCDDMDQALNRAGGKAGNKGSEAALTAIEMASLFQHHLTEKL